MSRGLGLLAVACALGAGCGGCGEDTRPPVPASATASASAAPSGSAAPWPKVVPLPPLAEVVFRRPGEAALVTLARVLVAHPVVGDSPSLTLGWLGPEEKPLPKDAPLAELKFELASTLRTLVVYVRGPDGKERRAAVRPDDGAPKAGGWRFGSFGGFSLSVDDAGVQIAGGGERLLFQEPLGPVLAGPGRHVLRLTGRLVFEGREIAFETPELPLDVTASSAEHVALAELERRAAASVAASLSLASPPPLGKPSVEDVAGNRAVRFVLRDLSGRNVLTFAELVFSPAGVLLSGDVAAIFACVAEGTPIETPTGSRLVETLAPGDLVVGVDVDSGARVATRIVRVGRSFAPEVILVGGLRATRTHPLFVGDAFVPAGAALPGVRLLGADLSWLRLEQPPAPSSPGWVVDLSVEWPHTYFASGLLVHNKSAGTQAGAAASHTDWASIGFRPGEKEP